MGLPDHLETCPQCKYIKRVGAPCKVCLNQVHPRCIECGGRILRAGARNVKSLRIYRYYQCEDCGESYSSSEQIAKSRPMATPIHTTGRRKVVNVRLTDEQAKVVDTIARLKSTTKSSVIRKALQHYIKHVAPRVLSIYEGESK